MEWLMIEILFYLNMFLRKYYLSEKLQYFRNDFVII